MVMKRILVVEVNWLGDCVMTFPVFKVLKENFPSSYICVLAVPRVKELFELNPYIDEVIIFDEKGIHKSLRAKIKFITFLKKKKIDTAILIHRSFTRACICALAGIKTSIGFKRFKTSLILTHKVKPPSDTVHRADYYFSLLEAIGIRIEEKIPKVSVKTQDREEVRRLVDAERENYSHLVAINPSANWSLKQWPQDYFVQLIDRLIDFDCKTFLIGTQKEYNLAQAIKEKVHKNKNIVNLCGQTTLTQLAAILELMDILISSDSGPAHLAASVGTKVLLLFGPTSPSITAPRGDSVYIIKGEVSCPIPCYNLFCEDNVCMKKILPCEVFSKVKEILGNG